MGAASDALLAALADTHATRAPRGWVLQLADLNSCHFVDPPNGPWRSRSPGTPAFAAPECCGSDAYDGFKADVWALGVLGFLAAFAALPCSAAVQARRRAEADGDGGDGDDDELPPSVLEVYRAVERSPEPAYPPNTPAALLQVLRGCLTVHAPSRPLPREVHALCSM